MSKRLDDIPEDVRDRAVSRDDALGSMEKELRMTCPNDTDYCHVGTEIPTIIKWLQSIEESTFECGSGLTRTGQLLGVTHGFRKAS